MRTIGTMLVLFLISIPPVACLAEECLEPTVMAFPIGGYWTACPAGDGELIHVAARLYMTGDPCPWTWPLGNPYLTIVDGGGNLNICPGFACPVPYSYHDDDGFFHWEFHLPAGLDSDIDQDIQFKVHMTDPNGIDREGTYYAEIASYDLNGDLVVNLADVVIFAGYFYAGTYDHVIDYNHDGELNLSDISLFAQHSGHSCAGAAKSTLSFDEILDRIESANPANHESNWGEVKSLFR